MARDERPVVIFVLGGPGAGKGTQCARISAEFGYKHISAGDCLREERLNDHSELGSMIEHFIEEGLIVPIEITCELLMKKMRSLGWTGGKFLIDGFPRDMSNLEGWLKASGDCVCTEFIVNLVCPDEVMLERLLQRGALGSGRIDDNPESAKKRLKTFHDQTELVIQYFKNIDRCYDIDANQDVEEVWKRIKAVLEASKAHTCV